MTRLVVNFETEEKTIILVIGFNDKSTNGVVHMFLYVNYKVLDQNANLLDSKNNYTIPNSEEGVRNFTASKIKEIRLLYKAKITKIRVR